MEVQQHESCSLRWSTGMIIFFCCDGCFLRIKREKWLFRICSWMLVTTTTTTTTTANPDNMTLLNSNIIPSLLTARQCKITNDKSTSTMSRVKLSIMTLPVKTFGHSFPSWERGKRPDEDWQLVSSCHTFVCLSCIPVPTGRRASRRWYSRTSGPW